MGTSTQSYARRLLLVLPTADPSACDRLAVIYDGTNSGLAHLQALQRVSASTLCGQHERDRGRLHAPGACVAVLLACAARVPRVAHPVAPHHRGVQSRLGHAVLACCLRLWPLTGADHILLHCNSHNSVHWSAVTCTESCITLLMSDYFAGRVPGNHARGAAAAP